MFAFIKVLHAVKYDWREEYEDKQQDFFYSRNRFYPVVADVVLLD